MRVDVVFAGRATWRQRAAIDAFNPSLIRSPLGNWLQSLSGDSQELRHGSISGPLSGGPSRSDGRRGRGPSPRTAMPRVHTHPGEVLREEFLAPLGLPPDQFAEAIDMPANSISELLCEYRSVTADTALRLAKHFDTTPEFWLNLQMAHGLSKAKRAGTVGRRVESYSQLRLRLSATQRRVRVS